MCVSGYRLDDVAARQRRRHPRRWPTRPVVTTCLQELVYLGLLEHGVYTAARGMVNVGLAHTDDQLATALDALDDTLRDITRAHRASRPASPVRMR